MTVYAIVYYGDYFGVTKELFFSREKAIEWLESEGYDWQEEGTDWEIEPMEVK